MKNFYIPTINNTRCIKMDAKAFLVYADKHSDMIESSKFVPAEIGSNGFGYFLVEEKSLGLPLCIDGDFSEVDTYGTEK